MAIDKTYQPAAVEGRIYAAWEKAGAFRAGRPERAKAEPFCVVIPPPNVTGALHMGHALNNTLQDILCRFERMRGKDVLWQPGTDHAGIATQAVVERQLMERQEPGSRAMGREAFIKRVWQWKAESGGAIIAQLKRLGASCDWSRERFTMDEGLSRAVAKVFVTLYREGLIYKDKRLVNWDPELKTAISDLEVQQVETKGHLWYVKYPISGSSEFITVATTRPETILGDVAVAVHPQNERLKHLIGKQAIVPLVDRHVPVVGDEYADPEKGTGAVKITPAHDFNDYKVWQRHKDGEMWRYPPINILAPDGSLLLDPNLDFKRGDPTPETFRTIQHFNCLDRFVARQKIVERLQELGRLEKIESHNYVVPHGDRSGVVIEPFLTDQWYVDAKTLAQPAIEAVRQGGTKFVPPQWEATFFNWMENIQPWCISRQIWWGHQIPAWYGLIFASNDADSEFITDRHEFFVAEDEEKAVQQARAHYRAEVRIVSSEGEAISFMSNQIGNARKTFAIWRDPDVLDTWFSSALWPFSTLGWPDQTPELKRFYPTSVLVTGFDIIFFWVARMMMMGLHFMKEVPFPTVYIHALVRDATGAKMSKSKGNVIDPLALIDQYGADALRFTLAAMAAQGRDIKLSAERIAGYRNFATKLWNAARFAELNGCARDPEFDPQRAREGVNLWIIKKLATVAKEVTSAIETYKFNDAAGALYRFVWNVYCDWYLEFIKPVLTGSDSIPKKETRAAVVWLLDEILKLLHPFMPFITEELWQVMASDRPIVQKRENLLALSRWPSLNELDALIGLQAPDYDVVIGAVSEARAIRTELNIALRNVTSVELQNFDDEHTDVLKSALPGIARLVGASTKLTKGTLVLSEANPPLRTTDDAYVEREEVPWSPNEAPLAGGPVPDVIVSSPIKEGMLAIRVRAFDTERERLRLQKAMTQADADIARVDQKLGNADFLKRAPEEIVEGEREKRDEAQARRVKLAEALERLKGAA